MITAIVIDDEQNALETLNLQIRRYCPDVEVLELCDNGKKGIEVIKRLQPDLVFLDIEMPHVNGFEVLQATSQYTYHVVFTTAYDQFAIKAIKYSVLDYLLKPIDILELQAAVSKAMLAKRDDTLEAKMGRLMQALQNGIQPVQKIALPVADSIQLFDAAEILRCESESNYTHIFLVSGKKITTSKTLKDVEQKLTGLNFFRVHQSHLINTIHISKVTKDETSSCIMTDGMSIPISRNKRDAFMEIFRRL